MFSFSVCPCSASLITGEGNIIATPIKNGRISTAFGVEVLQGSPPHRLQKSFFIALKPLRPDVSVKRSWFPIRQSEPCLGASPLSLGTGSGLCRTPEEQPDMHWPQVAAEEPWAGGSLHVPTAVPAVPAAAVASATPAASWFPAPEHNEVQKWHCHRAASP